MEELVTPTVGMRLVIHNGQIRLKYKDNEGNNGLQITTTVEEGGAIVWKRKPLSAIKCISKIDFSDDIFEIKPTHNRKKTVWVAVLKDDINSNTEYSYEVEYEPIFSLKEDSLEGCDLEDSGSLPNLRVKPPTK